MDEVNRIVCELGFDLRTWWVASIVLKIGIGQIWGVSRGCPYFTNYMSHDNTYITNCMSHTHIISLLYGATNLGMVSAVLSLSVSRGPFNHDLSI